MGYARGYDGLAKAAGANRRFRAGFPEGYGLAFANLYVDFGQALMARKLGLPFRPYLADLPTIEDGLEGMTLIECATRSHVNNGAWVDMTETRAQ